MKPHSISIDTVYQQDAEALLAARAKAKLIHSSGDIDASGDEIEQPFRNYLRKRLPLQYHVAHGHIVDRQQNVSPQFDVIIADSSSTPVLFEAENGTQYVPYESVYAIGELKSTYYKSQKPIQKFGDSIKQLLVNFEREETPNNYIGNGIFLGDGLSVDLTDSHRNPLFSFALFCDDGDMAPENLADQYVSLGDSYAPQIVACMNGSVVVKSELKPTEGGLAVGLIDVSPLSILKKENLEWIQLKFTKETQQGHALATLMLAIFNHLNSCVLMKPPIGAYLDNVLKNAAHKGQLIPTKVKSSSSAH